MPDVSVIYEDEFILALNKPAGLMVHGDGRSNEETLSDWILEHYPALEAIGEPLEIPGKRIVRPGIVHRLDRGTSGVIVVAKTDDTFFFLKEAFKKREVSKIYHAIVWGRIKEGGIAHRAIGRSARDFRRFAVDEEARGVLRDARTRYEPIFSNKEFTHLEVRPETGRTHQIRVHMKSINHPIVCDKLYAPKRPCALGFARHALHAYAITIKNQNGAILRIEAPPPADFEHAVALLQTS
ncbi:RluA family pseudouridine synthase [bacterium]|nr:RluA family pseudouridine synthase [bacterium]